MLDTLPGNIDSTPVSYSSEDLEELKGSNVYGGWLFITVFGIVVIVWVRKVSAKGVRENLRKRYDEDIVPLVRVGWAHRCNKFHFNDEDTRNNLTCSRSTCLLSKL